MTLAVVVGDCGDAVRSALEPFRMLADPLLRRVDQLVVDVGDVDHPRDVKPFVDQVALDRVEDHRADHVADVRRLVDRRAAQVHPHLPGAHGLEQFLLAGEGVVDAKGHEILPKNRKGGILVQVGVEQHDRVRRDRTRDLIVRQRDESARLAVIRDGVEPLEADAVIAAVEGACVGAAVVLVGKLR